MIKYGINFILVSMGLIFLTIFFYFSINEEKIINKFVSIINKSYLFNLTPIPGIMFLIFGEFILWESQNNKSLNEMKIKFLILFRNKLQTIKRDLLDKNKNLLNMKSLKILSFGI